jgi:RNA polymerase sigma factor (TIGR02999 family)
MTTSPAPADVTDLLLRWSDGDAQALDQLLPLVYGECRVIAARQLRGEPTGHTLNPTALVHELYIRLVDQRRTSWKNRVQFFGVSARIMRRILVDHARARRAKKRVAPACMMTLEAVGSAAEARVADVIAIDEALERLARLDPEQERIVELRFFAGLTVEETAQLIGRSPRTVKREWQLAKAWLFRELHGTVPPA